MTINCVMSLLGFTWFIMFLVRSFIEDIKMNCDSVKQLPRRDTRTGELNDV